MVKAFSEFESNLTAVERIKEYCDLEHEVLSNLLFINYNYKLKQAIFYLKADWDKNSPGEEWPNKGSIEFNDYSVRYRDDLDFALRNISITIEPKEKVKESLGLLITNLIVKSVIKLRLEQLVELALEKALLH